MEEILSYRYTLKQYVALFLALFGVFVLLTVFQYVHLYYVGAIDTVFGTALFLSLLNQLGFCSMVGLILLFPYRLLGHISPNLGFRIVFALLAVLAMLETALVVNYLGTYEPMGPSTGIAGMSHLIGGLLSSNKILAFTGLGILAVVGAYVLLYQWLSRYYHWVSGTYPFTIVLLSFFLLSFFLEGNPITANKTRELAKQWIKGKKDSIAFEPGSEYPLLKKNNAPDVLGEHLGCKNDPPNISIIIVEGLGADFVGSKAAYGGFMPFLDSLASKSLSWKNFVAPSTCGEATVPTIMGSLPNGKNGFLGQSGVIDRHSIFSILQNEGYFTSFHTGRNISLNDLDDFLRDEKVDVVLERANFGKGYQLEKRGLPQTAWHYSDEDLFKKAATLKKPLDSPSLDVFVTASTQKPYQFPDKEQYRERVKSQAKKQFRQNEPAQKVVVENMDAFASLSYADDALKMYFEQCKDSPRFDNTVFLVTGDHTLPVLPNQNELKKRHVPLLVYAKGLREPKELDELASHFDLAPSLLAFLEKNHDVAVPKRTAWMGGGLTMQGRFNEDKEIPFNGSERKGKEMLVKGNRYLEGDKVYAVREGLTLRALPNEDHIDLANAHQHLEMLQEYVLKKNRIVPDLEATTQPNGSSLGKKEMVYVNSVLHNDDFDLAYSRARKLAFDKKYRQASTLCKYILQEVPSYIDARILLGRIHAWQGHYKKAEEILRESIKKNTVYGEAYAALLDVYFWSDQNEKALGLYKIIEENGISDKTLAQKLRRAYKKIQRKYPPHRIVSFVDIADFEKHLKT